jgi:AcrR family transcriptional regulator
MMAIKGNELVVRLRPGRPRSDETNDRILRAAMTMIREVGIARMSLDEVASRARVSKPTIYRRWPSKTDLAAAAIVGALRLERLPPSGRPLLDIVDFLSYFRTHFEANVQLPTLGSLLQESNQTSVLLETFRDSVIRRVREHFQELIQAARAAGQMRTDGSVAIIVEMLIGAYYARAIVGDTFSADWAKSLLKGSGLLTKHGLSTIAALAEKKPRRQSDKSAKKPKTSGFSRDSDCVRSNDPRRMSNSGRLLAGGRSNCTACVIRVDCLGRVTPGECCPAAEENCARGNRSRFAPVPRP